MLHRVEQLEEYISNIETLIKNLRADRDKAWSEVARLKATLDERELQLLQLDEEANSTIKKYEEQEREREALIEKIGEVTRRVEEDILPLLRDGGNDRERETPHNEG